MSRALTAKQSAFIAAYMTNGGNGADAYETAYGKKGNRHVAEANASRLLRNAKIKAELDRRQGQVIERATQKVALSKEWVLQELVETYRQAVKDGNGATRTRALELIGKELRMFVDRKEVRLTRIGDMTREEVLALLSELDALGSGDPALALPPPPESDRDGEEVEGSE